MTEIRFDLRFESRRGVKTHMYRYVLLIFLRILTEIHSILTCCVGPLFGSPTFWFWTTAAGTMICTRPRCSTPTTSTCSTLSVRGGGGRFSKASNTNRSVEVTNKLVSYAKIVLLCCGISSLAERASSRNLGATLYHQCMWIEITYQKLINQFKPHLVIGSRRYVGEAAASYAGTSGKNPILI